jgi:hypothetical protein
MNSRNHLVPTPTVDRNGKTTTVYRRQEPTSTAANFPGPSIQSAHNRRGENIDAVNDMLRDHSRDKCLPSYNTFSVDIIRGMSASKDENYSALVREMVETVVPTIKRGSNLRSLMRELSNYDEGPVRSMHAHREYLAANANMVAAFNIMRARLIDTLGVTPELDGRMPTIEAHLYAEQLVEASGRGGSDSRYLMNPDLMGIVEKHPGHVHELMEFISRDQDTVQLSDFEEYLKQGALRAGNL